MLILLAWVAYLAGAVALWGIITLVGAAVLRPLGVPKGSWLFLGGPVGLGVIGTSTFIAGGLGIPWGIWVPIAATLLAGGLAWFAGKKYRAVPPTFDLGATTFLWAFGGTIIFAGLQFGLTMILMTWPDAVPIMGDAQFHLAGSKLVMETGNVNPFTALGGLYEPTVEVTNHYYPVLWHALVALLAPLTGISLAHNLWVFVIGFMIWPIGLATLSAYLLPKKPWIGAVAPLVAVSAFAFPAESLVYVALGPFSVGAALLIPIVTVALAADSRPGQWWLPPTLLVLAAFAAHPSTGILAAVPLGMLLLVRLAQWLHSWRNRAASLGVGVALLAVIGVAIGVIMKTSPYQAYAAYSRATIGVGEGLVTLFGRGLFYWPVSIAWVTTSILAAYGFYVLRRSRPALLTAVMTSPFFFLYIASTGPDGFFREMTGLWWKDFSRLIVPCLAVIIVFASVGIVHLASRIGEGKRGALSSGSILAVAASATLGVAGLVGQNPPRLATVHQFSLEAYSLDPMFVTPLDADTVVLLELLDGEFNGEVERDAYVIGPHASGVGFTPLYSDLHSYMPAPQPYTQDQSYLEGHFGDIHSDPRVCEIIREANIVAFLEKPPPDQATEERQSGLYNVDTSEGFVLIDQSGQVRLWEITACD